MNRFDHQRRRLGWILVGVFAALMAASVVLVVQSYDRLRFEALHGQRMLAEEVAARVNTELRRIMAAEEARPPTDYDFLVVTGERYVQRSPLSSLAPATTLPGVVGYFQVDADGQFSTPLLPADVSDLDALALTQAEVRERRGLEERLRDLLEREVEGEGERKQALTEASRMAPPAPQDLQSAASGFARQAHYDDRRDESARDSQKIFDQLNRTVTKAESAATAERSREVRQVTVEPAADADDAPLNARISAFRTAVDPFSLALLDGEHLVLYRKVWLDGQRIQGVVIEQAPFLDGLVGRMFTDTSLARYTGLAVAYEGEVIKVYPSLGGYGDVSHPSDPDGSLLLRSRLAEPGSPLELVFTAVSLPLGPAATTLVWASVVMALVLCGGFYLLYRLGRHHIRLAEQQQDFVSAVSHELKTPLTSIRMYGEILKAGWADEEKKRAYYDYILSESERLSRLIGNVLQLARITRSDTARLTLKMVPVPSLLDQVESKISSALSAAGLVLEQERDAQALACSVRVDEDAFMRVMINLVDNAIKFSAHAERRVLELGCRLDGGWVEFRVRDFGPGVARDQMKKIFKLFYRPENELTRETVGTGIGLALVRELMDQMGGKVDVVNRQPGAEFRVRLRVCIEP